MDQGTPAFAASESLRHYDILVRLFVPSVREAIYREGLSMVRLVNSASRRRLDLRLFCHERFEAEG